MAIKISDLPTTGLALATDEYEINQSGISKKVTNTQLNTFFQANLGLVDGPVASTNFALARWDGVTGELLKDSTVTLDDADVMEFPLSGTMIIPLICLDTLQERVNGDGIKVKGLGNTTLMRIGDVLDTPQTQNTLMNFQAKQDVLFFLEGDTDDVGSGDTPLIKMTSQANSSMFNTCIDTTGDVVIDLGSSGLSNKDILFKVAGNYVTAPATGTAPDYAGGGGKVAPTNALVIKGDRNIEISQFVGGGLTSANLDNSGHIVRGGASTKTLSIPLMNHSGVGGNVAQLAIDGAYILLSSTSLVHRLHISFSVPSDFVSLISLDVLAWPDSTAAGSPRGLDLSSSYGLIGEDRDNTSQAATSLTTDFGTAEVIFEIDVSNVFTSIAANDVCALKVDPTNLNSGELFYHSLRMVYST